MKIVPTNGKIWDWDIVPHGDLNLLLVEPKIEPRSSFSLILSGRPLAEIGKILRKKEYSEFRSIFIDLTILDEILVQQQGTKEKNEAIDFVKKEIDLECFMRFLRMEQSYCWAVRSRFVFLIVDDYNLWEYINKFFLFPPAENVVGADLDADINVFCIRNPHGDFSDENLAKLIEPIRELYNSFVGKIKSEWVSKTKGWLKGKNVPEEEAHFEEEIDDLSTPLGGTNGDSN